jgi:oxygen-dependent protoporphyrinogen oxidase
MAGVAPRPGGALVVVGAGITGLAAAHRWVERGRGAVVVLEATDRAGGQIRTERTGGYLLEAGPDALVAQKPAGVALCDRLGLGPSLRDLAGSKAGTQILHRGRLVPVPEGFLMMAPTRWAPVFRSPLFSWRGKLRMALEPFVPRRGDGIDDETLASFVTRRLGREVLERIAEPVIAGLYTADAQRLSLRLTLPRFLDVEAREGSVIRALRRAATAHGRGAPFGHGTGRSGFVAVDGGLERIIDALLARLPRGCVRTGAHVTSVATDGEGRRRVILDDGRAIGATALIFATPAWETARALRGLDAPLADALLTIRYASCATVNVAYRRSEIGARLEGLGFFVPRSERLPILACSYVSEKFEGRAPADEALFRVFVGGATRPDALESSDGELVRETSRTLARVLSITGEPVMAQVYRAADAMPQFDAGAAAELARIRTAAEGRRIVLAGSAAGAFGIPDCVRSGEEAAERAAALVESDQSDPGSPAWVAYHANQNA